MLDSVRTQLTLWYTGVLALVLVAFSFGVHALLARNLHERLDAGLRAAVEAMIASLAHEIAEGEPVQLAAESTVQDLYFPHQALAIFDAEGRLLAERHSSDQKTARLPASNLVSERQVYLFTERDPSRGDDDLRVAARRVDIAHGGPTYLIAVSQSFETVTDELEALRQVFFIAVPLILVLAGLGGWFLARKSLAPVLKMSQQARRIGAENLEERLPVVNPRDELGRLAVVFNELLSRLSAAFAGQRQFMADASHELRTPLSVMQTAADVTLEQPQRAEDEYRDSLKMIAEQTRRLTRVVEDMFTLARVDAGSHRLRPSQLYLDELLAETARAAGVLASRKGVTVELLPATETPYEGDEDLLRQMLMNLLDNAIKHTPPGGRVGLSLARSQAQCVIEIADTGDGIPVEAQPRIFERFYRVNKARSRAENGRGGAGLGLAIARWIAEAHNGSLILERSDHTGSAFAVRLPAIYKS